MIQGYYDPETKNVKTAFPIYKRKWDRVIHVPLEIDPDTVHFADDGAGHIGFTFSGERRVDVFCEWLTTDYQNDPPGITEVAHAIGTRMARQTTEVAEFDGNAWNAVVTADGVETSCLYSDDQAWLPLPDAAVIIYRFWETTRAAWRPTRFDKAAAKFAHRHQIEPLLPWKLDDWTAFLTRAD